MIDFHQTINNIKSDILSIWVNSDTELYNFNGYFTSFQKSLEQHLGIKKCIFLTFESSTLFPLSSPVFFNENLKVIPLKMINQYFNHGKIAKIPDELLKKECYQGMTDMILMKNDDDNECIGLLLLEKSDEWQHFLATDYVEEFVDLIIKIYRRIIYNQEIKKKADQYQKLYAMSDLFHSTMDIDLILENVLHTIQENFPNLNVDLILSNDQDRKTTVNIKLFDYLSERAATVEAFVSGEITIEKVEELNCEILNAPIKGRQAIYGILQVSAPVDYFFTSLQQDFISKLAQASGNALENAKLYHQSHRLISDLQLINETSHRLNMRLNIEEMLVYLQRQLIKSFQPHELCFVFKENDQYEISHTSTSLFKTDESNLYIEHVKKHFASSNDPIFIADFSRLVSDDVTYHSIMAIPMLVEEKITGFSIVLHKESYFFSFDSFKLMQSLIHHSSLAIANSILRNQLQEMVDRDHLTGLYARGYLDRHVEYSLQHDESGMFLLVDIDNFKQVNDTYGHQIGDQVLVQIAHQFMQIIGTRGICARWGGEEMSIYVPNTKKDEALKMAKHIVEEIPKVTSPTVTISAGLIIWDQSERPDFQSVFLQADTVLYQAKNSGKNQFCFHDSSLQSN